MTTATDGRAASAILYDRAFWEDARQIMVPVATRVFREAYLLGAALGAREKPEGMGKRRKSPEQTLGEMIRVGQRAFGDYPGVTGGIPDPPGGAEFTPLPFDFDAIAGAAEGAIAEYTDDWWRTLEASTQRQMRDTITRGLRDGLTIDKIIADFDPLFGPERAANIAVSETTTLMGRGAQATYQRAGLKQWIWRTSEDLVVDADCEGLKRASDPRFGGHPFPMTRSFEKAHPRCRCVLPGNLVLAQGISAATSRLYKGPIVTIVTALGYELTVTPNHPIATTAGWLAASELHEGGYVLSDPLWNERLSGGQIPDDEDRPALIEEVVETLAQSPGVVRRAMPSTAEDFHGDGGHGEIDVVATDRPLRMNGQTLSGESGSERALALVGAALPLVREGSEALLALQSRAPANGSVGARALMLPSRFAHLRPANGARLAATTGRDARLAQSFYDEMPGDLEAAGEFGNAGPALVFRDESGYVDGAHVAVLDVTSGGQGAVEGSLADPRRYVEGSLADPRRYVEGVQGLPAQVALDRVVEVRRGWARTHVYNFETVGGWYTASGIVTHNCWPVPYGEPAAQIQIPEPVIELPSQYPYGLPPEAQVNRPETGWFDTETLHTTTDASGHKVWTDERTKLHDQIVARHHAMCTEIHEHPQAFMMGGGPASGKSTVIKQGFVKLPGCLEAIDSDAIKAMLPEYNGMLAAKDPRAAGFAHEESSYLSKRIMKEASAQKKSFLLDGTGDSTIDKLSQKIQDMRFGGHTVSGEYMTLDTERAVEIAKKRALETGRDVDLGIVRDTHVGVSQVFGDAVDRQLFDEVRLWDTNIKDQPRLVLHAIRENGVQNVTIHNRELWRDFLAKADLEPGIYGFESGAKYVEGVKDTMDLHTFNGKWTKARTELHDRIVADILGKATPVPEPTAYMMGGGPASGKSTLIKNGSVKLPKNIVEIDSDAIKALLPEYQRMVALGDEGAAGFAHEESSYLSKRILKEASLQRKNLILDGTGDSTIEKLTGKIREMRLGGHRVIGEYVSLDTDLAIQNADLRAIKTGRKVDHGVIRDTHVGVSRVFGEAVERGLFDEVRLWDTNINGSPRLVLHAIKDAEGVQTVELLERGLWRDFLAKAEIELGTFSFDQAETGVRALNRARLDAAKRYAEARRTSRFRLDRSPEIQAEARAVEERALADYLGARAEWRTAMQAELPEPWVNARTYDDAVEQLADRGLASNVALRAEEAQSDWIGKYSSREMGLNTPLPQRERLGTLNRLGETLTDMRRKYAAARDVAFEDVFLSTNTKSLYVVSNKVDLAERLALRVTSPQRWEAVTVDAMQAHFVRTGRAFSYGAQWEDAVRHEIGHAIAGRTKEIGKRLLSSWESAVQRNGGLRQGMLSDYGFKGGADEAIAEVVSVITHPAYGTAALPENFGLAASGNRIESWMEDWGFKMLDGAIP